MGYSRTSSCLVSSKIQEFSLVGVGNEISRVNESMGPNAGFERSGDKTDCQSQEKRSQVFLYLLLAYSP